MVILFSDVRGLDVVEFLARACNVVLGHPLLLQLPGVLLMRQLIPCRPSFEFREFTSLESMIPLHHLYFLCQDDLLLLQALELHEYQLVFLLQGTPDVLELGCCVLAHSVPLTNMSLFDFLLVRGVELLQHTRQVADPDLVLEEILDGKLRVRQKAENPDSFASRPPASTTALKRLRELLDLPCVFPLEVFLVLKRHLDPAFLVLSSRCHVLLPCPNCLCLLPQSPE